MVLDGELHRWRLGAVAVTEIGSPSLTRFTGFRQSLSASLSLSPQFTIPTTVAVSIAATTRRDSNGVKQRPSSSYLTLAFSLSLLVCSSADEEPSSDNKRPPVMRAATATVTSWARRWHALLPLLPFFFPLELPLFLVSFLF
ncbi:uncharacterized protein DS421_2g52780 [Arachis hypogaea]|nr:uncharacterized protein DS421_2g52780 [Arachis hypogaea]